MLRCKGLSRSHGALCIAVSTVFGYAAAARGQATYYGSPTGSDTNPGLSPSQPWASLAKVDSTNFAPGSTILFQAGGNWYDSLNVPSSGTPTAPITYGSYGAGPNPTFWGSNILNASAFTQIAGTPASDPTYSMTYSTTVNSMFE